LPATSLMRGDFVNGGSTPIPSKNMTESIGN